MNRYDKYEYKNFFEKMNDICNEENEIESDEYRWKCERSPAFLKLSHYIVGEGLHAYKLFNVKDKKKINGKYNGELKCIYIFPNEAPIGRIALCIDYPYDSEDLPLHIFMNDHQFCIESIESEGFGSIRCYEDTHKNKNLFGDYLSDRVYLGLQNDITKILGKDICRYGCTDIREMLSVAEEYSGENNPQFAEKYRNAIEFYDKAKKLVEKKQSIETPSNEGHNQFKDLNEESVKETEKFKTGKTNIETKENISETTKESSKSKQEEPKKQKIICNILDLQSRIEELEDFYRDFNALDCMLAPRDEWEYKEFCKLMILHKQYLVKCGELELLEQSGEETEL